MANLFDSSDNTDVFETDDKSFNNENPILEDFKEDEWIPKDDFEIRNDNNDDNGDDKKHKNGIRILGVMIILVILAIIAVAIYKTTQTPSVSEIVAANYELLTGNDKKIKTINASATMNIGADVNESVIDSLNEYLGDFDSTTIDLTLTGNAALSSDVTHMAYDISGNLMGADISKNDEIWADEDKRYKKTDDSWTYTGEGWIYNLYDTSENDEDESIDADFYDSVTDSIDYIQSNIDDGTYTLDKKNGQYILIMNFSNLDSLSEEEIEETLMNMFSVDKDNTSLSKVTGFVLEQFAKYPDAEMTVTMKFNKKTLYIEEFSLSFNDAFCNALNDIANEIAKEESSMNYFVSSIEDGSNILTINNFSILCTVEYNASKDFDGNAFEIPEDILNNAVMDETYYNDFDDSFYEDDEDDASDNFSISQNFNFDLDDDDDYNDYYSYYAALTGDADDWFEDFDFEDITGYSDSELYNNDVVYYAYYILNDLNNDTVSKSGFINDINYGAAVCILHNAGIVNDTGYNNYISSSDVDISECESIANNYMQIVNTLSDYWE